jgi:hypothetical protein
MMTLPAINTDASKHEKELISRTVQEMFEEADMWLTEELPPVSRGAPSLTFPGCGRATGNSTIAAVADWQCNSAHLLALAYGQQVSPTCLSLAHSVSGSAAIISIQPRCDAPSRI